LSPIVQMVDLAQHSRAPMQLAADAVACHFVATVVAIAPLTFFASNLFEPQASWVIA